MAILNKHRDGAGAALADAPTSPTDLVSAKPIRMLVIDDDAAVCQVIQSAFAQSGYYIESACEPSVVEDLLCGGARTPFDLVLLDYVLPGLQPQQIFAWLRKHQPDASIIMITGQPSYDSAVDGLRARVYDYVTKPFAIANLRQAVTKCLESKGLLRLSESALREAIGSAVRERRKAMDLTLVQLAARSDVSVGFLSQIELGKNSASIETFYRISLALGMKLPELFQAVQRDS
jgi:DNA-binding NtrC family response regulator